MSHIANRRGGHQKRQRVPATDTEATTTSPRVGRPVATTSTSVDDTEEETTTRRARTTAQTTASSDVLTPVTTAVPVVQTTQAVVPPLEITTTSSSSTAQPVAQTTAAAGPVAPVQPITTRSSISSRIPSTTLSSSSQDNALGSNAAANDATANTTKSDFPTGTVAGVIAGVVALVLLVVGLLIWRKKRSRKNGALLASPQSGGYSREKSMDGSDIFPGGVTERNAPITEKGNQVEAHSMQVLPNPSQQQQRMAHADARNSWSQTNNYAAMPLPSPAVFPASHPSTNSFLPPSNSFNANFAPPKAAMMGTPSTRSSVANPYGAIAAAGHVSPKFQQQSFAQAQQEQQTQDQSPFEDPQWANKVFIVNRTFEPSMPDELIIYPNDHIRILMAYDDGWVLGENLNSVQNGIAARGVFPRDCVEELIQQTRVEQDDVPLQNEASNLTRAPTLPPLNLGRESQSFSSAMSTQRLSTQSVHPQAQQQRLSRTSLSPKDEEEQKNQLARLSTSSSLHGALDRFPPTPAGNPNRQLTPVAEDSASQTSRSLKRTSSLMAAKDQDLFAQLGQVMQADGSDEEEEEEQKHRE